MAVVNLGHHFLLEPVEDLELSQKPTSGTKGAANGQCWNEMLPRLNLWYHNLIDLTAFYQVMSSWFKLRILMLMEKKDSIGDRKRLSSHPQQGVFITMACEECLFIWTPYNFHGLLFATSNANQLQANEKVFWEWKNSATWRFWGPLNQMPGGAHHGGASEPQNPGSLFEISNYKMMLQLGANGRQLKTSAGYFLKIVFITAEVRS